MELSRLYPNHFKLYLVTSLQILTLQQANPSLPILLDAAPRPYVRIQPFKRRKSAKIYVLVLSSFVPAYWAHVGRRQRLLSNHYPKYTCSSTFLPGRQGLPQSNLSLSNGSLSHQPYPSADDMRIKACFPSKARTRDKTLCSAHDSPQSEITSPLLLFQQSVEVVLPLIQNSRARHRRVFGHNTGCGRNRARLRNPIISNFPAGRVPFMIFTIPIITRIDHQPGSVFYFAPHPEPIRHFANADVLSQIHAS